MNSLNKLATALLTAIFCLTLTAAPTFAQQITATLTGTVTDPNGAVVTGATVTATSSDTGLTKSVTTSDSGRYTIPFLQPGNYNISVEASGFTKVVRENIRLEVAQTATLDIGLGVAGNEVQVEISGEETPLLQTETSNLETTVEQKLIEDLPSVERNIFSFVNLTPGAIDGGTALGNPNNAIGSAGNRNFFDSNFSVSGGRSSSNEVLLDGVTNTIGDFNGVAISPPQDSVREFKVISGVAPAEYGRTAGGIVTVATKAGGNRFSGAVYEYFQDRELNANGFVRNRNGLPRINVNRNQFGGAIGGPVFLPAFNEGGPVLYNGKNRTFFFFNYEARREDNPFNRELLTVPTEAERRGNLSSLLDPSRGITYNTTQTINNQQVVFSNQVLYGANNPGGGSGTPVFFGQVFNPFATAQYVLRTTNTQTGAVTDTVFTGRAPFPNNNLSTLPVCPNPRPAFTPGTSACLDPVALAVLRNIPLPNVAGVRQRSAIDQQLIPGVINNFVISDTSKFTRDIFAGRIDQKISENQQFFGRFSYEVRRDQFPNYFNSPASNARFIRDTFFNATLNHVYNLTSNVVNNARYGYTRVRANQRPNGQGFDPTSLGLPSYLAESAANLQFPNFLIGGGADGQTLPGQLNTDTIGGAGNDQPRDVHSFNNSVTVITGSHTIKGGGEYRLLRFFPFQFFDPTGQFAFNRIFTRGPNATISYANEAASGSALASFLLGTPASGRREAISPLTIYHHYYAGFIQDDWKIRRNLTLNLGLRYDYETGTGEVNEQVTTFDFERASPLQGRLNLSNLDPFVSQLNPNIRNLRGFLSFPEGAQTSFSKNRFAPRLGFAYSYDNKTTLRGGIGMFYLPASLEGTSAVGSNFTTNLIQSSQTTGVAANTVFLTDPFPTSVFPNGLPINSGNRFGEFTQLGGNIIAVEPRRDNPYTVNWNLVAQRQLAKNLVLDVAYVGARGIHLPVQQLFLNQLSADVLNFARNNFNRPNTCTSTVPPAGQPIVLNAPCPTVTAFLQQVVDNPFTNQIPTNVLATNTGLNAARLPRAQLLRPFPQYQGVTWFRPHIGDSLYNALQVNLQKRFSDGLSASVNYVFSKLLDTGGVGNGAAFLDASPVQDVNNYKGGEYSLSSLDVPHAFTASFTYELPVGRGKRFGKNFNGFLNALLGGFQISGTAKLQSGTPLLIVQNGFVDLTTAFAGVGNGVRRPNRVGENTISGKQFRENARSGLPVIDRAAFANAGTFEFGNAARTYDDIRRDPYKNFDFSVIKNIGFNENRQKIQLRAEFLNAFNYVVFGTPVTNIDSPNFGLITTQGNRPRIIQLVGRFTF